MPFKRAGFGTIFLLCIMPLLLSVTALFMQNVFGFAELIFPIAQRRNEQRDTRRHIQGQIELLPENVKNGFHLAVISADPVNYNELLLRSDSLNVAGVSVDVSIYSMNYSISGTPSAGMANFPPSKKSYFGEKHFFLKATQKTDGVLTYCTEAAVEVSGDIANILWWREFVIN